MSRLTRGVSGLMKKLSRLTKFGSRLTIGVSELMKSVSLVIRRVSRVMFSREEKEKPSASSIAGGFDPLPHSPCGCSPRHTAEDRRGYTLTLCSVVNPLPQPLRHLGAGVGESHAPWNRAK